MSWLEVPDPPAPAAPTGRLAAWSLGTVPVLLAVVSLADPRGWWLGWALPIAVVDLVLVLTGRRWPKAYLLVAPIGLGALALVLGGREGALVAALAVVGTTIWSWGLGVIDPPIARLEPRSVLRPAMVAAGLADVLLVVAPRLGLGLRAMAVAGLLVAAAAALHPLAVRVGAAMEPGARGLRGAAGRVDDALRSVGRVVGRVVPSVAMVPVAVVVGAIWLVQRIARYDPLAPRTRPGTTWADRVRPDALATHGYSGAASADERTLAARASGALVVVLALALVVGAAAVLYDWDRERSADEEQVATTTIPSGDDGPVVADCAEPPPVEDPDPVLSTQPEYEVLACERSAVFAHAEYRVSTGVRLQDFDGETIHLADGERRTWRPPDCGCRRLVVWWLGGSAAWGEGQRDLQTLPSMLARAAWDEGVALDIRNFAMPTHTFNQEVHRFAELTTTEPLPDLVLSYSGGNDVVFQALRGSRGDADDSSDISLLDQTFDDVLRNGVPVDPSRIEWTPNPQEVDAELTPAFVDAVAEAAGERYDRNLELAERLAASIDRPIGFVWQPLLAGSSPDAGPDDVVPSGLLDGFTRLYAEVRADLPAQVIDMGSAYEEVDHPVFFDLFHTGEEGAALLADQLWPRIAPLAADAAEAAEDRPTD